MSKIFQQLDALPHPVLCCIQLEDHPNIPLSFKQDLQRLDLPAVWQERPVVLYPAQFQFVMMMHMHESRMVDEMLRHVPDKGDGIDPC